MKKENELRVAGFLDNSTVNGLGCRSVIFLSGCDIKCPGCQNKAMQDINYGDTITIDDIIKRIESNMPIISGVTISGGDPSLQHEQVGNLISRIKEELNLNVWVYTGRTFNQVKDKYPGLMLADIIVDGPYIESKDTSRLFVGSDNQRIIDVKKSSDTLITYEYTDFNGEKREILNG